MPNALIALGSNLGDREKNIKNALESIGKRCRILKHSSIYESKAMYYEKQPDFLNSVIEIETRLKPRDLLKFLKTIEKKLGRKKAVRYGPRTIDLDILLYGDQVIKQKDFEVPHPRMHERLFVLKPLAEIYPKLRHPVLKKTIIEMAKKLKNMYIKLYNFDKH